MREDRFPQFLSDRNERRSPWTSFSPESRGQLKLTSTASVDTGETPWRRMVHENKSIESDPSSLRARHHQQGGVHIFRPLHRLMCSTSTPTATGKEWTLRTFRTRWWQLLCGASARASGTGIRERVGGEIGCMHRMPSRQRQTRGRERSAHHVWGMPLLLLFVCWWLSSGTMNGKRCAILVLGESVSVGFGGGCPSACSGHGYCTNPSTETCTCHQGWAGGDCSIRELTYPCLC